MQTVDVSIALRKCTQPECFISWLCSELNVPFVREKRKDSNFISVNLCSAEPHLPSCLFIKLVQSLSPERSNSFARCCTFEWLRDCIRFPLPAMETVLLLFRCAGSTEPARRGGMCHRSHQLSMHQMKFKSVAGSSASKLLSLLMTTCKQHQAGPWTVRSDLTTV